jgi:hypothetical protein
VGENSAGVLLERRPSNIHRGPPIGHPPRAHATPHWILGKGGWWGVETGVGVEQAVGIAGDSPGGVARLGSTPVCLTIWRSAAARSAVRCSGLLGGYFGWCPAKELPDHLPRRAYYPVSERRRPHRKHAERSIPSIRAVAHEARELMRPNPARRARH